MDYGPILETIVRSHSYTRSKPFVHGEGGYPASIARGHLSNTPQSKKNIQ